MTEIYIIRHCETVGNSLGVYQGSCNYDLSETGIKQLEALSRRCLEIDFDCIFTSPLKRACQTATAVAAGRNITVTTVDNLREMDGGVLEGVPFTQSFKDFADLEDIWNNHPQDFDPPKGEAMKHTYERIWNTVLQIARENQGKKIAVSTHGGVIRTLFCRLFYNDINRLSEVPWAQNTSVSLIKFDDTLNPTVDFYNDYSHLPKHLIPKGNIITREKE